MQECVIVTLIINSIEYDVVLPAEVALNALMQSIAELFSNKNIRFDSSSEFVFQGRVLPETGTLSDFGIWDGSILSIKSSMK